MALCVTYWICPHSLPVSLLKIDHEAVRTNPAPSAYICIGSLRCNNLFVTLMGGHFANSQWNIRFVPLAVPLKNDQSI